MRCLAILMQTDGRTSMNSHISAVFASRPLAVLDQVSWKRFQAIPLNLARRIHVHLLVIIAAGLAQFALAPAAAAGDRAAITIGTEKPLGPALGTFSTFGAFSDSGILVTESRVVSAIRSPFGLVSHLVLNFEGALGTFTIRAQIIETVIDGDVEGVWINEGVWVIVDGTGAYSSLHGGGNVDGTVDHEANLITRIYTGMVQLD